MGSDWIGMALAEDEADFFDASADPANGVSPTVTDPFQAKSHPQKCPIRGDLSSSAAYANGMGSNCLQGLLVCPALSRHFRHENS